MPGKEGPQTATLRECKERFSELRFPNSSSQNDCWCKERPGPEEGHTQACFRTNALFWLRLNEQALELDEKRRAALEDLALAAKSLRFWERSINPSAGFFRSMGRMTLDHMIEDLDALTPAPQEKDV